VVKHNISHSKSKCYWLDRLDVNSRRGQIIMDTGLGIIWFLSLTIWLVIEKNNPNNYL